MGTFRTSGKKKIPKVGRELNFSSLCINSVSVYKKPLDQFPNLNYPLCLPPLPPSPCAVNTQRNSENFVTAPSLKNVMSTRNKKSKKQIQFRGPPPLGYIGGLCIDTVLKVIK